MNESLINTSQPVFSAAEPLTSNLVTSKLDAPLAAALEPARAIHFTLAHLLLVIAVVAVLSALVTSLIFPTSTTQMSSAGSLSQPLEEDH